VRDPDDYRIELIELNPADERATAGD